MKRSGDLGSVRQCSPNLTLRLKILNSPSVKKVTWGYMNAFDWLVNQLTSKKDRSFAMVDK